MKLIQLPNGSWVRSDQITRIMILAPSVGHDGTKHLPRVTVWCGQSVEVIDQPGMDEAQAFADALAALLNGAHD